MADEIAARNCRSSVPFEWNLSFVDLSWYNHIQNHHAYECLFKTFAKLSRAKSQSAVYDFLISVKWIFLHCLNVGGTPLKLLKINYLANFIMLNFVNLIIYFQQLKSNFNEVLNCEKSDYRRINLSVIPIYVVPFLSWTAGDVAELLISDMLYIGHAMLPPPTSVYLHPRLWYNVPTGCWRHFCGAVGSGG